MAKRLIKKEEKKPKKIIPKKDHKVRKERKKTINLPIWKQKRYFGLKKDNWIRIIAVISLIIIIMYFITSLNLNPDVEIKDKYIENHGFGDYTLMMTIENNLDVEKDVRVILELDLSTGTTTETKDFTLPPNSSQEYSMEFNLHYSVRVESYDVSIEVLN